MYVILFSMAVVGDINLPKLITNICPVLKFCWTKTSNSKHEVKLTVFLNSILPDDRLYFGDKFPLVNSYSDEVLLRLKTVMREGAVSVVFSRDLNCIFFFYR